MNNVNVLLECNEKTYAHTYPFERHDLYDGINISFMTLSGSEHIDSHEPLEHVLEINYCRKGRIGWKLNNGKCIYLGEHDFSLHTLDCCSCSKINLPNGYYEGIKINIDLNLLSERTINLLSNTNITGEYLFNKYCKNNTFSVLIGNEETDTIFSAFYDQPKDLQFSYWKIKVVELLLYLNKFSIDKDYNMTEIESEQVKIIRNIHEYLITNLNQRITIDELAYKYLINPTTLKSVFKEVYGTSIASHIKQHRLKIAARLLLETQKSIKEIASVVGYESQSKFSKVFKEYYDVLPTEYRNKLSNKTKN